MIRAFLGHILGVCISCGSKTAQLPKITISSKNNWFSIQRFSKQNWCMRIVFFHGGISSREERPGLGAF